MSYFKREIVEYKFYSGINFYFPRGIFFAGKYVLQKYIIFLKQVVIHFKPKYTHFVVYIEAELRRLTYSSTDDSNIFSTAVYSFRLLNKNLCRVFTFSLVV